MEEEEKGRRSREEGANVEGVEDETPRLSYRRSFSGTSGRVPSEPAGMKTPPFHVPVSVPFAWEEVPGKPRPLFSLAAVPPIDLPLHDGHPQNPPSTASVPSSSRSVSGQLFSCESVEEPPVSADNKETPVKMSHGKKRPRDVLLHLQASLIAPLLELMCMAPKRRRTV
ncbi:unnamed protein product [Victoria cruziana]